MGGWGVSPPCVARLVPGLVVPICVKTADTQSGRPAWHQYRKVRQRGKDGKVGRMERPNLQLELVP